MDILKAREKARKIEEGEEPTKAEKQKVEKKKKRALKKKSQPSRKEKEKKTAKPVIDEGLGDGVDSDETAPTPEPTRKAEKKESISMTPEEMQLSDDDLRELYKTQEMPELPDVDSSADIIPDGVKSPEEMALSDDDLNNLYKTQEMPELPGVEVDGTDQIEIIAGVDEAPVASVSNDEPSRYRDIREPVSADMDEPPMESITAVADDGEPEAVEESEVLLGEVGSQISELGELQETPLEFLSFILGDEEYALPLARISEIIKPREITEVPRIPHFAMGIISLRGVVIPVFDLAKRLNLGSVKISRRSRIVIVRRQDDELVGLAVDSVQDVVRVLPGDIEPPPPTMGGPEAQFLEGVGRAEETRRSQVGTEADREKEDEGLGMKRTRTRKKLVILLNLDKVAVL